MTKRREDADPPIVLALRDADRLDLGERDRKLRHLLKRLKRDWGLRCEGYSIPQVTPIMHGAGEGI